MKYFRLKRVVWTFYCMALMSSMLYGQEKRPSWIKKEPVRKDSYIGIVQAAKPNPMDTIPYNPHFKDDAHRAALWKIASQMPWEIDNSLSLFAVLSGKGLYKMSLDNVLLPHIQVSPYFTLVEEWENETEYWCYFSVKKDDAKMFIEQLVDSSKAVALRLYDEAKAMQTSGYMYRAALKYAEALDSLHPAIFRHLPVEYAEGTIDLGRLIYDSYLNVYKGVEMTTEVKMIPAVHGEGVPGSYVVQITQNGNPLRKLGVVCEYEGVISAEPTTDDNGMCHFSIDNVSSKSDNQTINFCIDTEYLMELPAIYGVSGGLEGRHLFPSLKIPVSLFDPRVYTKLNTVATDTLLRKSLKTIFDNNRDDVVYTERFDSADVVVEVEVGVVKEASIDNERYHFVQYSSSLGIKVKGVADDVLLTEYGITDFKLMLPASRSEAQVRQSALREMIRQMNRELPTKIKEYEFDKRELVWRPLVSVSK